MTLLDKICEILEDFPHWNAYDDGQNGHIVVTECDEPTFHVHDKKVAFAKDYDSMRKEVAQFLEPEMTEQWERNIQRIRHELSQLGG